MIRLEHYDFIIKVIDKGQKEDQETKIIESNKSWNLYKKFHLITRENGIPTDIKPFIILDYTNTLVNV